MRLLTSTRNAIFPIVCILGRATLLPPGAVSAPADSPQAERLFAVEVWPLLQDKCLGCHGRDEVKIKGGFDLRTREGMLRGGESGGVAYGRDHNPKGMTIWFAGGAEAVDVVHHIRDVHVTLLRLLGLDDHKLTYFHAGRFKQLSQFGGQVIPELIA